MVGWKEGGVSGGRGGRAREGAHGGRSSEIGDERGGGTRGERCIVLGWGAGERGGE
jgi:hypothetical protein